MRKPETKKYTLNRRGFSIVEMLIYVFILSLMLVVIINTIGGLTASQRKIKATRAVELSSITTLERIVREIRNAVSVDVLNTSFGTNPGSLSLNSTDSDGNARTVKFVVDSGKLRVIENGVDQGPLVQSGVTINNLVFTSSSTPNSTAIKINMTISSGTSTAFRSEQFYGTAVLRGTY